MSDIAIAKKTKDIAKINELEKNVKDPSIKQKLNEMKAGLNKDINQINKLKKEVKSLKDKDLKSCGAPPCKLPGANYNPSTGLYNVVDKYKNLDTNRHILVNGQYIKNPSATSLESFIIGTDGKLHWPEGGYEGGKVVSSNIMMYAIDKDGKVVIGALNPFTDPVTGKNNYYSHPNLIGGENPQVLAAGEIRLRDGKITLIDNNSGHYEPSAASLSVSKQGFSSLPATVFRDNNNSVFKPR